MNHHQVGATLNSRNFKARHVSMIILLEAIFIYAIWGRETAHTTKRTCCKEIEFLNEMNKLLEVIIC